MDKVTVVVLVAIGVAVLLALVLPVAKVYLEEWRERKRRKLP
jgi:hypothetical protein